jgi:predicted ABC-type ATPase
MIVVIAGVNGAGKSSVVGSNLRQKGIDYFNPDEKAQALMVENVDWSLTQANSAAWQYGYDKLSTAVSLHENLIFETTLGGNSVTRKLHEAADKHQDIKIIFCGLESADLHIERVASRVKSGGHDIPSEKIRERWVNSLSNLITLLPICNDLKLYDNSTHLKNGRPSPRLLLAMKNGQFTQLPVKDMPDWAKPIASVAIKVHKRFKAV